MLNRIFSKEFNYVVNGGRSPFGLIESQKKKSFAIFGDPWGPQQLRNKNLVKHLNAANTASSSKLEDMEQAIIFFNAKPSKGIKFCIEHKFFPERPENVVNFLLNANGLSKFAIGQYLASPDTFN